MCSSERKFRQRSLERWYFIEGQLKCSQIYQILESFWVDYNNSNEEYIELYESCNFWNKKVLASIYGMTLIFIWKKDKSPEATLLFWKQIHREVYFFHCLFYE